MSELAATACVYTSFVVDERMRCE